MMRNSMPWGCDPAGGPRFSEKAHAQATMYDAMTEVVVPERRAGGFNPS